MKSYIHRIFISWDVLGLCCINALAVLPISVTPILIADIIDLLLLPSPNKYRIYIELLGAFSLVLFVFPARYLYKINLCNFKRKKKYELIHELHGGILKCPYKKSINIERGSYIALFNSDIVNIVDMNAVLIENIPLIFLSFLFSICITGYILPVFLLFYSFLILLLLLLHFFSKTHLSKAYQKIVVARDAFNNYLSDMIDLIFFVKEHALFSLEMTRGKRYFDYLKNEERLYDNLDAKFSTFSWLLISLWNILSFSGIIWIKLSFVPDLSTGSIVLLQGCSNVVLGAFLSLSGIIPRVVNGMVSFRKLDAFLEKSSPCKLKSLVQPQEICGKIEFYNVSYKYENNENFVLDKITFSILPSNLICIVGPSGAGKSTIIKILVGLLKDYKGNITVDDIDLRKISEKWFLRFVSVVPQNIHFFSGTIRENITYGEQNFNAANLDKAIDMAGLSQTILRLPKGVDTYLSDEKKDLSGGEKQRIAIARALYRNPRILILDESLSGVDAEVAKHIQLSIKKWKKDTTIIVITHRLQLAKEADKIIVVDKGKIAEEGTHKQLLNKGGIYAHLFYS